MTEMSQVIHLHSAHVMFHRRRSHLRTQKASELGLRSPTSLGELKMLPRPPSLKRCSRHPSWWRGSSLPLPKTHTCSQPFGPSNWGPVTYCWTRAPPSLAIRHRLNWAYGAMCAVETGACFIVFNVPANHSRTSEAQCSIVEDGILVRLPRHSFDALQAALRTAQNFSITTDLSDSAHVAGTRREDLLVVYWTDDTSASAFCLNER